MGCEHVAKFFFTPFALVVMFIAYMVMWSGISLLGVIMWTFGPLTCAIKDTIGWGIYFWTKDEKENPSNRINKALDILQFIFKTVRTTDYNNNSVQTPLMANPV